MSPYRTRRFLRRFFIGLGALTLAAAALLVCWMLWLGRYVVYTEDGVKLDFSLNPQFPQGVAPEKPGPAPTVDIHYNEGNGQNQAELASFRGYYVTAQDLIEDFDTTADWLRALPYGSTVALQVKDVEGYFYYSSSSGRQKDDVNISKMDQLIQELKTRGHYLIARLPAFQDRYFFLDNERERVPYGLAQDGGNGSLWPDKSIPNAQHYWLNPASTGALNYVVQIVTELRNLGFHEVVFSDFRFPNTDKIRFDGDKAATLNEAAQTLMQACTTDTFAVSFAGSTIALPQGRCRLYFENTPAADIPNLAAQLALENPNAQLVFLTDLMDTRYDAYSVLRPLAIAAD